MTKEVLIHISSLHQEKNADIAEENEKIEVIVPGIYYFKNGKHYVLYEEVEENGKVTKNQMKIYEDGHVEVRKSGVLNAHIIFETGKKHPGVYQTPFGQIQVAMDTREVETEEEDNALYVGIDYALEVNQEPLADCRIEIQITPREGKGDKVLS